MLGYENTHECLCKMLLANSIENNNRFNSLLLKTILSTRHSPVNSFDQRSFSSRITAPTSILNDSETRSMTSIVSKTPNWNEQPGFILTPFFSNKSRRSSGNQSKSNVESNSSLTIENNTSKESSN